MRSSQDHRLRVLCDMGEQLLRCSDEKKVALSEAFVKLLQTEGQAKNKATAYVMLMESYALAHINNMTQDDTQHYIDMTTRFVNASTSLLN